MRGGGREGEAEPGEASCSVESLSHGDMKLTEAVFILISVITLQTVKSGQHSRQNYTILLLHLLTVRQAGGAVCCSGVSPV